MASQSVENYLKAIYHLGGRDDFISTNAIAERMDTKASSTTDMLKRLADIQWIEYRRYNGAKLTNRGLKEALLILRKHRLWEVFLLEKLKFSWDEVHEMAEELEHLTSNELIDRLDDFLDNPQYDPHGDPIPDRNGKLPKREKMTLTDLKKGEKATIVGVLDSSTDFLKFLEGKGLTIGHEVMVEDNESWDGSLVVKLKKQNIEISRKVSDNLFVTKSKTE